MKIGDIFEVEIYKQDFFGNGICKINDMLIFVENGLIGDVCIIEITEVKKNFCRAKINDIVVESLDRIDSKCPYYYECGGCQLLHQEYSKQLLFKYNKICDLFSRKGYDIDLKSIDYGNDINYRNKVIFRSDGNSLGFYKEKTHEIIPVYQCMLLDKDINKIYVKIHEYLESNKRESVVEVVIRKTSLNEIMVCLNGTLDEEMVKQVFIYVNSLYINDKLVLGNEYITEELNGLKFRIYKNSFFQVNYEMTNKLYGHIINYVKDHSFNSALDLYCGTGTIGLLISNYVNNVVGIEIVEDAVIAANINRKINNVENVSFILGKVEDYINDFSDIDLIIVDPPRSGLDNKTINNILSINPESIVYVSCGPDTLIRDLELLKVKYEILKVNVVDMFPNTYHCESVVILERK